VVLEKELKQAAKALRVPVSNLVRTILEDALTTAQAVGRVAEEELRGAADRLGDERRKWKESSEASGEAVARAAAREKKDSPSEEASVDSSEASPLEGVLGFQSLVLAVPADCALCGHAMPAGSEAYLGVREGSGPRVIVGPECLPGHDDPEEEK